MTATVLPRSDAPPRRPSIDRATAAQLAATEYARCAEFMTQLQPAQWAAPTVNTGWVGRGSDVGAHNVAR
jgi:hypothetical protein